MHEICMWLYFQDCAWVLTVIQCSILEWKILIDSNAHDCERLIDITSLLPFLLQNHLLTSNEQEILMKSTFTECQKIQYLLLLIHKKGAEGYRGFLRAIEHESSHLGHRELYTILTNCKPRLSEYINFVVIHYPRCVWVREYYVATGSDLKLGWLYSYSKSQIL